MYHTEIQQTALLQMKAARSGKLQ